MKPTSPDSESSWRLFVVQFPKQKKISHAKAQRESFEVGDAAGRFPYFLA